MMSRKMMESLLLSTFLGALAMTLSGCGSAKKSPFPIDTPTGLERPEAGITWYFPRLGNRLCLDGEKEKHFNPGTNGGKYDDGIEIKFVGNLAWEVKDAGTENFDPLLARTFEPGTGRLIFSSTYQDLVKFSDKQCDTSPEIKEQAETSARGQEELARHQGKDWADFGASFSEYNTIPHVENQGAAMTATEKENENEAAPQMV